MIATAVASHRYIAFLLSTLPKLESARIYSPFRWKLMARALSMATFLRPTEPGTPAPILKLRRLAVLKRSLRHLNGLPGIGLEFGVHDGTSLRFSSKMCPDRVFYGFDSFQGYPPDEEHAWQIDWTTSTIPDVP